ncbi:unnamed protein product [Medioppia subpectinata]|uniref:MYND-type domain-containing protein n=1 Tax=Medioppia subpectinata TaxID=1979941 RepID=A0A7R9KGM9_9ACAR|nr:unnamed protein product [Medioppia subpectinata]CAG2103049.1 unnamed protein product [Medioppia subpectinata]
MIVGDYPQYTKDYGINDENCGLKFIPEKLNITYDTTTCFHNKYDMRQVNDMYGPHYDDKVDELTSRVAYGTNALYSEAPWSMDSLLAYRCVVFFMEWSQRNQLNQNQELVTIFGYGKVDEKTGDVKDWLQKGEIVLQPYHNCLWTQWDGILCSFYSESKLAMPCEGDSGAGIVQYTDKYNTQAILVGTESGGSARYTADNSCDGLASRRDREKCQKSCHKRDPKRDKMPVISSKPYIAGDVVFKFKPLLTCIRDKHKGKHCDNCLKLTDQLKSDKTFATERHALFDGSDVCFNDIKVNVSDIPRKRIDLFDKFCQEFKTLGVDFKATELFELFKLVFITTYKLERNIDNLIDYRIVIGEAVCLELWPISHSCLPNTAIVRKDEWFEIRAMKSIAIGEEITMASINLFNNYATSHWNFSKSAIRRHEYEMNSNLIIYLEAMYGEYNPTVTYFLLESFMCFANSMKASHSLLTLWFKRIERHVLVTHGSDHPWDRKKRDPKSDEMPVISSKPYIAGDVVFKCKPLLVYIQDKYKGEYCDNCLKPTDQLKRCSKCRQMYYCGKNCQTIDWSFHKNECKVFRENRIDGFHTIFIPLLRLYLRIKSDKTFATERHTLIDGSDVCLNDMNIAVNVRCISEDVMLICGQFKSIGIDFKAEELNRWFKLVLKNTDNMSRESDNPISFAVAIGGAVCPELWPISHSCVPNTAMICRDGLLEIRAMKSIAVGEELTRTWIPLHWNRDKRRQLLSESHSVCNCDKCRLHLDKDMDYEEFGELLKKHTFLWNGFRFGFQRQYQAFDSVNLSFEMDSNFIEYLEAMYGEFHPTVTLLLLQSFIYFANSKKASHSLLTLWFKRIERHVLVTHGSDYPWYAMLRNQFDKSLKI